MVVVLLAVVAVPTTPFVVTFAFALMFPWVVAPIAAHSGWLFTCWFDGESYVVKLSQLGEHGDAWILDLPALQLRQVGIRHPRHGLDGSETHIRPEFEHDVFDMAFTV